MGKKIEPTDFLMNTDYELDKIVFFKEGDFTNTLTFSHTLSFTPLIFGFWSTDKNFTSVNSIGVFENEPVIPGLYTPVLGVSGTAYPNKTIKLEAHGENSGSAKIYYRLYAFEPSDSKENAPQTAKHAGALVFDTDYNYRKLLAKGIFTNNGEEYNHNLGYIPQVMVWIKYKNDNGTAPMMESSEFTDFKMEVTDKKIRISLGSPIVQRLIDKIYWRIYYDKA